MKRVTLGTLRTLQIASPGGSTFWNYYQLLDAAGHLIANGSIRATGGLLRVGVPALTEGVYLLHLGGLPVGKFVVTQP